MGVHEAAGVVLAGGRSSRMGEPKAGLEWHGTTLLYRAAAILTRSVDGPVVVVGAPGQTLPALPAEVAVVVDPVAGLGPVQGIAAGLGAVAGRADVAFVCATDLPFLHPAFVRRVLRGLAGDVDVALPVAHGFRQPLAAAYRTALAGLVATLLAAGNRAPGTIFERSRVARLDDGQLLDDTDLSRYDPELESVVNVNTPEEYAAARRRPAAEVVVEGFGTVRAATVAAAADATGRHGRAILNGRPVTDDRVPLVRGDVVQFLRID